MKKKVFSILALLLMAAGSAVAQNTASVTQLTKNSDGNWVLDAMPGYNGVLEVTFFERFKLDSIPMTWTITVNDADSTEAVTRYSAEEGDTTMGWLMVQEGADVRLVPPTAVKPTVKSVTLVDVLPPVAAPTLTLGEMTQGGDPLNNGSGSETYFSPTFSEGQQVAVFYKNTSGQTVKALSDALTASDISNEGKSTTINVTIDDADKTQPVTYIYPATMANEDGTVNYGSFNFTAQSGTEASLSTVRNCCKGSGAWDGNALPSVSMASQIAIWKLTMTDVNGMIMAQKVTVKVGGNKVAEASASGVYFAYPIVIYLALDPATMGTGTLRIEADEFGTIYYYQKDGGVSLTAGKFYQSAVELKR